MKTFATALIVAAGLGLGASMASAAPVSAPGTTLNVQNLLTPTQYYGGGYRYRPRPRYRPYCHYVRRCSGYYPYQRCWRERVCR